MMTKFNTIFQELKDSGYTDKELLELFLSSGYKLFSDDVEEEKFKNLLTPLYEIYLTKNLAKEDDREQVLENTILQYLDKEVEGYRIIKNHLLELSEYDKVIERDGDEYFYLIDLLMQYYQLHFQALETYEDIKKSEIQGIVFSSSHSPEKVISKEHNAVKNVLASMPDNQELKFRDNLYIEYKNNPHAVNKALYTVNMLGGIKSIPQEKNEYIKNARTVINSALPFEKKEIYKSANILILLFFRKDSIFRSSIKIDNNISNNKIIEINSVLMEYLFETKNQLNKDNVSQIIQVRTDFDMTPLYEFQNPKNIKIHPMLEDTDDNRVFMNEFIENFKKIIPQKSDDNLN